MKKILTIILLLSMSSVFVGCTKSQLRPYGIKGYELYTSWIARSPYWTDGVPRVTDEQKEAFAIASWMEHEKVMEWIEEEFEKLDK